MREGHAQRIPSPNGNRQFSRQTADPKWHFIVLDVGEDQGVLLNGEVLVSRQGKLLGKAKVSRVQPGRCVANMVPGWEFGEIAEGDQVIPAVPRS